MALKARRVFYEGFWIWMFLIAILVRVVLSPEQIESWYSRGLFLRIRSFMDIITNAMPFALFYLFFALVFLSFVLAQFKIWPQKKIWWKKVLLSIWGLVKGAAALAFFFTILWGYNYGRVPLETQLALEVKPQALDSLIQTFDELSVALETYRSEIPDADTSAMNETFLPENLKAKGRNALESLLENWDFPVDGSVNARFLKPKGILLRFNTSGVYLPWTGEGHIDAGLHPVQQPFVMIHEMGHGYGFTDEGTCNFLSVVAGLTSDDPFIRYSVLLGYWRYMASNIRPYNKEAFSNRYEKLSKGIRADLSAIYEYQNAYPEIFPSLRYYAYDTYLRAQGIKEGILNYDRVLGLMDALENKEERRRF